MYIAGHGVIVSNVTEIAISGMKAPSVFDAELFHLDYFSPDYESDWHRCNAEALDHGPVAMCAFGPSVLGYEAVHTVLRDRRFRMPPALGLQIQGITEGPLFDLASNSLLSLDGDEHNRLRRLVARAFTPRSVERLHERMSVIINELVDSVIEQGECDVVADIARQFPIAVICGLLGAPAEDWPLFSAWTDDAFKVFQFDAANETPTILAAYENLGNYIDAMVAERRHSLTDDLVSHLIRAEDDGDRLTSDELRMLVTAILTGGTDTTRNQLAAAVEVFCAHADQWALLADDPTIVPNAVDEVLRFAPILIGTMRIAIEDVQIEGMAIPAETFVDVNTAAANRDPAVFDEPHRFDITRRGTFPALTFGGGIHFCLGAHLARAELAVALTTMAKRMPNIRLTGDAPWKPIMGISGPLRLPVAFEPGH